MVFDIGAHRGHKSKLFLELGCRVIAVEPQKNCMSELKKLQEKYPRLVIENCAVGKQEGEAKLHIGENNETSTLSKDFKLYYERLGTASYFRSENIYVTTLGSLFGKYGVPYYLKVDAEGLDEQIIATLAASVPVIEFEYLQPFHSCSLRCVEKITSLGSYHFNFCRNEHPSFYFPAWKSGEEFRRSLNALPNSIMHGNVFAKRIKRPE